MFVRNMRMRNVQNVQNIKYSLSMTSLFVKYKMEKYAVHRWEDCVYY
ncbi:hypothetical protein SAMN02746065_106149 [Desulfocicer vacuolatum DSM 3385]|uniref:Uncharacterized protein n=1 Tax=Desulfocicer vacuolatum DSM 3385 TaxID=1121400 RepID=A0A1W2AYX5_9BACT|nr:hypothetical protein SAMN02746065_106149 [Desulfocicer vacuolatum DSM 3385]